MSAATSSAAPVDALAGASAGTRFLRGFLPFALAYLLSFLLRNVNAVAGPAIAADIGVDQVALGVLTSAYFAAFAGVQLPMGLSLDRYGPHRTEAFLLLFAALGGVVFATGHSVAALAAGRALIGFGVGAGLMAAFTANARYWPPSRLPLANGCALAFGGVGAALATEPVQRAVALFGWRPLFWGLGAAALLLSAALALAAPRRAPARAGAPAPQTITQQIAGMVAVLSARAFWRVAVLVLTTQAVWLGYQSYWTGVWLRDVAGLSPDAAARALLWGAGSIAPGFLASGILAERLGRRGISTAYSVAGWSGIFILIQIALCLAPAAAAPALWVGFFFFGAGPVVGYVMVTREFPPSLAGRANTALNLPMFVLTFAVQAGVGPIAQHVGHEAVLGALVVVQVAGFAWFLIDARPRRPLR